jgi:hypothetical protein
MTIELRWTPQRVVWIGFGLSAVAVLACIAIVVVTGRGARRAGASVSRSVGLVDAPVPASPLRYAGAAPSWTATAVLAVSAGLLTAAVSRPWIGLVVAAVTPVVLASGARGVLTLTAPVVLALSRLSHTPELAWLALALVAVDLACTRLRGGEVAESARGDGA